MFVILVLALISYTNAASLKTRLDYLDPILYQEHIQSPNGHYKYGFESSHAIAHQVHDADGTSKGFYSYLDDQGKIQHVEYVAGHDGFKVLGESGSPLSPGYTPEVELARQAHEKAYQEVQNRVLKERRDALTKASLGFVSERQFDTNDKVSTHNNFPQSKVQLQHIRLPVQSQSSSVTNIFGDDDINLFSGRPKSSNHNNNYNRVYSFQTIDSTTTPRPIPRPTPTPNRIPAKENKVYILPPPTVDHYEKIWPLPPIRFRDLEVEVNGRNLYDPTANNVNRYNHIVSSSPQNVYDSTANSVNEYKSYNSNVNFSPQNVFSSQQYVSQVPKVPVTPVIDSQANIDAVAAKNAFSIIKQKYKFV